MKKLSVIIGMLVIISGAVKCRKANTVVPGDDANFDPRLLGGGSYRFRY